MVVESGVSSARRWGWSTGHRPQLNQDDFFFSGAGLYSFCISRRRISNALPEDAK